MAGLKFTIDREAWNAGFAAGEAGKALTACPYRMGTKESLSWHSGYIEGKANRKHGTPDR
jgi:ribosome modulation factor